MANTSRFSFRRVLYIIFAIIVLVIIIASQVGDESGTQTTPVAPRPAITSPAAKAPIPDAKKRGAVFTKDEEQLKAVIDEKSGTQMLDVYYALARLTDFQALEYPFYAMKNPKGEGYIGVLSGIKSPSGQIEGMAMFLVKPQALNQTNKSDLERSIHAINGLAKEFNHNVQFAQQGYDYLEVKEWIE